VERFRREHRHHLARQDRARPEGSPPRSLRSSLVRRYRTRAELLRFAASVERGGSGIQLATGESERGQGSAGRLRAPSEASDFFASSSGKGADRDHRQAGKDRARAHAIADGLNQKNRSQRNDQTRTPKLRGRNERGPRSLCRDRRPRRPEFNPHCGSRLSRRTKRRGAAKKAGDEGFSIVIWTGDNPTPRAAGSLTAWASRRFSRRGCYRKRARAEGRCTRLRQAGPPRR